MSSTLDMNNNQIINLPFPTTLNSPARLQDVTNAQNITIISALTGTSGHTVPFLDGTNTWSGIQTFNAGILGTNTNPSSFTTTNVFNQIAVSGDNLDASGLGNVADAFSIYHGIGGSNTKGARQAFQSTIQLLSPTSVSNTSRNYIAGVFTAQAVSNDGGGIGTEKGTIGGINPAVILNAAATNMAEISGGEINTTCLTGSSVLDKWGFAIVQTSNDTVFGSRNDAAVRLVNQSGSVGWLNGIQFGDGINQFPVKTGGTLIKTKGGSTVVSGIDFSVTTFSGNALLTNGFSVGPTGTIGVGGPGISNGTLNLAGTTSGQIQFQTNATSNLLTINQPIQVGVIGSTAGQLTLAGQTSGSAILSFYAIVGIFNLGADNLNIDISVNLFTNGSAKIESTPPAISGGDTSHAYFMASGSLFGIFYGVGAPTITAAQGSLYLRTDGVINARLYINTTGSNVWTAFNTTT